MTEREARDTWTRKPAAHLWVGAVIRRWRGTHYHEDKITDVDVSPDRPGGRCGAYPECQVRLRAEGGVEWECAGDKTVEVLNRRH